MKLLLRKWWVMLIQGILLIVLSLYIFNHPGVTLIGITFWISLLILVSGITGILGWIFSEAGERESSSLLWSIVSTLLGLLLINKIGFAMNILTNLLGIWMVISGAWLARQGWAHKSSATGKVVLIFGLLAMIAGFMAIFNIETGANIISILLGTSILLLGIALILLAFIKRKAISVVKDKIEDVRKKIAGR